MTDLLERFGAIPACHVEDVLAPNLDVVFCGTALGRVSARARAYYANPNNYFWRTLYLVGLTPTLIKPNDYAHVLHHGIGLTDLCKTAYGQDSELPENAFDYEGLRAKIQTYQPRHLAFTSKTGAAGFLGHFTTGSLAYGEQPERVGDTRVWVLPSPSGQARIYWSEAPWRALAESVRT